LHEEETNDANQQGGKTGDEVRPERHAVVPSRRLLVATILAPLVVRRLPVLNDARHTIHPAARKTLRWQEHSLRAGIEPSIS